MGGTLGSLSQIVVLNQPRRRIAVASLIRKTPPRKGQGPRQSIALAYTISIYSLEDGQNQNCEVVPERAQPGRSPSQRVSLRGRPSAGS